VEAGVTFFDTADDFDIADGLRAVPADLLHHKLPDAGEGAGVRSIVDLP